jgi:hypothetical protein
VVFVGVADQNAVDELPVAVDGKHIAPSGFDVDRGDPPHRADPRHPLRMVGIESEGELVDELPRRRARHRRECGGHGPAGSSVVAAADVVLQHRCQYDRRAWRPRWMQVNGR